MDLPQGYWAGKSITFYVLVPVAADLGSWGGQGRLSCGSHSQAGNSTQL